MHPSSSCYVVRTHTRNKSVIFFSPSCVKTSKVIAAETINTYLEAKSSVLTNTRIPSCITISAFLCFLHHGTWMMPRCYGKYCSYIVSTKHHQKCVLVARVQKSDTHSLRQKMRQSTILLVWGAAAAKLEGRRAHIDTKTQEISKLRER